MTARSDCVSVLLLEIQLQPPRNASDREFLVAASLTTIGQYTLSARRHEDPLMLITLLAVAFGQRLTRTQERALNAFTLGLACLAVVVVMMLAQLTVSQIVTDNESDDALVLVPAE